MWEKWVMISSLAAITTLMRASIGEVARAPYGQAIAGNIFDECVSIAVAHGNKLSEAFVQSSRDRLVDRSSTLTASMLRDLQSGNNIEADHIIGSLIEKGKERGVATPNLEIVYCNLKTYELAHQKVSV
jgi:2-dehydropantoate 2-reductase